LQDKGIPMPVQQTLIAPPRCRMGSITDAERGQLRAASPLGIKYDTAINRESASEMLAQRADTAAKAADAPAAKDDPEAGGFGQSIKDAVFGTKRRQGMVETMAKQTARTVGNQVGRQILRGLLGGIFGGKR
jgi:DNA helicase HerA-like ATPase